MVHSSASSPLAPVETAPPPASLHQEVLLIASDASTSDYGGVLRQTYRVVSTRNGDVAAQYLVKGLPSLVIADADVLSDAPSIIRTAKALSVLPTVLVVASDVQRVPELLRAGCDAVLLKPFAPNLFYARVGRLLRVRTEQQGLRARRDHLRSRYAPLDGNKRNDSPLAATNRLWADMSCPGCQQPGAVSFEFASHRRAWYACLACNSVWMAKRRE